MDYDPDVDLRIKAVVAEIMGARAVRRDVSLTYAMPSMRHHGGIDLQVYSACTGPLGQPVHRVQHVALSEAYAPPPEREVIVQALDRIERNAAERSRSAMVGTIRHTVDPVLAGMMRCDPEEAIGIINDARILELDTERVNVTDQAVRKLLDVDTEQHVASSVWLDDSFLWRSDQMEVEINMDVPETVLTALVGRDLTALIQHPWLPEGVRVTGIDQDGQTTLIRIDYDAIPLVGLLPPGVLAAARWMDGTPIEFDQI